MHKMKYKLLYNINSAYRAHKLSHNHKHTKKNHYDIAIIGGGIIGTASARELKLRNPKLNVVLLEKENRLGFHQSGHNSGVVHAGIYYQPGSLKAKLCVQGMNYAYEYFDKEGIPYKKCGKLIVATDKTEVSRLDNLYKRAMLNNVPDVRLIEGRNIPDFETYCQGVKAIWSPNTGIVDWQLVTEHYGKNILDLGGEILLEFEVSEFQEESDTQSSSSNATFPIKIISTKNQVIRCRYALVCGGLQSDRLAKLSGCSEEPRVVPFRGEYLLLKPEKNHLVRSNIYPVPDPRLPFLGVHFTPRMNGEIWVGPNAVLALKREGYRRSDYDMKDVLDIVKSGGFWKLAGKYASFGAKEFAASLSLSLQVRRLKRFIPSLTADDLVRGPAGVRAQALSPDGSLIDEFAFERGPGPGMAARVLHCRNTPSPAATSSLAIAEMIADKVREEFRL